QRPSSTWRWYTAGCRDTRTPCESGGVISTWIEPGPGGMKLNAAWAGCKAGKTPFSPDQGGARLNRRVGECDARLAAADGSAGSSLITRRGDSDMCAETVGLGRWSVFRPDPNCPPKATAGAADDPAQESRSTRETGRIRQKWSFT